MWKSCLSTPSHWLSHPHNFRTTRFGAGQFREDSVVQTPKGIDVGTEAETYRNLAMIFLHLLSLAALSPHVPKTAMGAQAGHDSLMF
ncbi:hypothetical protein N7527_004770 [Penicillium freii]|nr:hypothetical protein N7527_004770 [Penicillium freii]